MRAHSICLTFFIFLSTNFSKDEDHSRVSQHLISTQVHHRAEGPEEDARLPCLFEKLVESGEAVPPLGWENRQVVAPSTEEYVKLISFFTELIYF